MRLDRFVRRSGLRLRIAAVALLAVGLALAVGGVLLVTLLHARLDRGATDAALLRARDIAALAEASSLPASLDLPGEESALVQVVDGTGRVIASSDNIHGAAPLSDRVPTGHRPMILTLDGDPLGEHDRFRVVAIAAHTATGELTVYAAESLERVDDTTSTISATLAAGLPVIALLAALITWWAVGRALRPVRAITHTMSEITASDLHRRVPVPDTTDEIGQLATTVNGTLARLDDSVERQRRFVADASHDLRSPLAALRADLEISITHPDHTAWTSVASDLLGDVEHLQHLTEDLLLLARLDGRPLTHKRPVDLSPIALAATQTIRRDDVVLHTSGLDRPHWLIGEALHLQRLVRNLIDNAEIHATTTIELDLHDDGSHLMLTVSDDGPGIPAEQRERVLEPFVRLDDARTRDTGGSGLGLAIVHEIVAAHQGTIRIQPRSPTGTIVEVRFPAGREDGLNQR